MLLVNVLSINLAALVVLWYRGYRPQHWFRSESARSATVKRVAMLVVAILVLSAFLGGVTLDSFQIAATETEIQEGASEVVAATDATLLDVTIERANAPIFQRVESVTVTIGVPANTDPPSIAADLDAIVEGAADGDVETTVRVVTIQRP